jgi:hypothetical protein
MVVSAGCASGAILGGLLVKSTWRLVFFVNVPIGIALLAVAGAATAVLVGSLPALLAVQFALSAAARPS